MNGSIRMDGGPVGGRVSAGPGGVALAGPVGATKVEKATIVNVDEPNAPPIKCGFNPREYTFTKQNTWTGGQGHSKGSNVPEVDFGSGSPAYLQMQLLFDSYEEQRDVREAYTDALWAMMLIDEGKTDPRTRKGRPPFVRFQWGRAWSFDAVIKSLSQRFTLFLADGTPVRALVDVTFQQIRDARLFPNQSETLVGEVTRRLRTVQEGDTLAAIAHQMYGDASQWRRIADANRLTRVRSLPPGTPLEVPHA